MDTFPLSVLAPSDTWWRLSGVAASPGKSVGGMSRFTPSDGGGLWLCDLTIPIMDVDQVHVARAMLDGFDGGATPVIVPACEVNFAPWPTGAPAADTTFSDGSAFSDGALFSSGGIAIRLSADAALRATTLSISLDASAALHGGERFSYTHALKGKRLYSVIRVPDTTTIKIRPPWREATVAPADLDFNSPGCVMRCINTENALAALHLDRFSTLSLQFEEALPDSAGNY